MAVERKRRGGSWGYRFTQHGHCYKEYGMATRAEAKAAEIQCRADLEKHPPLPPQALANIVADYLVDSAERGRSMWRLDSLRLSLRRHVIAHFGETKLIANITDNDIESLIKKLKRQGLKPKSIWHVMVNLRALLYHAMKRGFLRKNPAAKFMGNFGDIIGSTKSRKPPLDPAQVDRAAESIRHPVDKGWFNVARFTGMRLDECNRLQWADIDFQRSRIHIPGTKTEESDAWLPLAPIALQTLKDLREKNFAGDFIFSGRAPQNKGKKCYSRRYIFETIKRKTGIHLKAKDLRDYFASEVASKVTDPAVIMKPLRHSNMGTTAGYIRTVANRMKAAVEHLGATHGGNYGGKSLPKTAENGMPPDVISLAKLLLDSGLYKRFYQGQNSGGFNI